MAKYILKRVIMAIITMWAVVTITFIIMKIIPGNPFATEGRVSKAAVENLMRFYKLDQPLFIQYLNYLKSVITFDFGPSMTSSTIDANYYISKGLPVTIQLGLQALIVAIVLGMFLGIIAALNQNTILDYMAIVIAIIGVSVPSFIMARILTLVFSQSLGWFPIARWESPMHTVLPTFALAALPIAQIARLMRSTMLEVINQDYIKTAKAKGLSKLVIIIKHALKNSMLPIVAALGTTASNLLTGSFVIEKIFGIPGMGDALIKSIGNRDYPIIMAATVVYCLVLITIMLLIDLIYPFIDPRIKISGGGKRG